MLEFDFEYNIFVSLRFSLKTGKIGLEIVKVKWNKNIKQ